MLLHHIRILRNSGAPSNLINPLDEMTERRYTAHPLYSINCRATEACILFFLGQIESRPCIYTLHTQTSKNFFLTCTSALNPHWQPFAAFYCCEFRSTLGTIPTAALQSVSSQPNKTTDYYKKDGKTDSMLYYITQKYYLESYKVKFDRCRLTFHHDYRLLELLCAKEG
jgi:hypothetical protein